MIEQLYNQTEITDRINTLHVIENELEAKLLSVLTNENYDNVRRHINRIKLIVEYTEQFLQGELMVNEFTSLIAYYANKWEFDLFMKITGLKISYPEDHAELNPLMYGVLPKAA